jgi:hypothetical protein
MNTVVAVLFAVLWLGLVFLLARELLRRVFSGPQRDFVAAGFAIAVLVGATLPQSWVDVQHGPLAELSASSPSTTAAAPSAAPPAPSAAPAAPTTAATVLLRDVSRACRAISGRPKALGQGSLDVVFAGAVPLPPAVAASRHTELHFIGWSATDAHRPSTAACLLIDGRPMHDAVALYGGSRPDVAAAYSDAAVTDTGFEINVAPSVMPSNGRHVFSVVSLARNGTVLQVHEPRTIVIQP